MKALLGINAGPRKASEDPQGRSEIVARSAWLQRPEVRDASDAGIGFVLQLQKPGRLGEDFDPAILGGIPYGVHMEDVLTMLWQAEVQKDLSYRELLERRLRLMASWRPAPEYVLFHGADFGQVPAFTPSRYDWPIEPAELLSLAYWHESQFSWFRELGLFQAIIENILLYDFYGPDDGLGFKTWLPATRFLPRVGLYGDTGKIGRNSGTGSAFDCGHIWETILALSGRFRELAELLDLRWARPASGAFEDYFGFCAERGRIAGNLEADWRPILRDQRSRVYHLEGIGDPVVSVVEAPEYQDEILVQVGPDTYAGNLIRNRRVGTHAPIAPDDQILPEMIGEAMKLGLPEPPIFILEIEQHDRIWYTAPADALWQSYLAALEFIKEASID